MFGDEKKKTIDPDFGSYKKKRLCKDISVIDPDISCKESLSPDLELKTPDLEENAQPKDDDMVDDEEILEGEVECKLCPDFQSSLIDTKRKLAITRRELAHHKRQLISLQLKLRSETEARLYEHRNWKIELNLRQYYEHQYEKFTDKMRL